MVLVGQCNDRYDKCAVPTGGIRTARDTKRRHGVRTAMGAITAVRGAVVDRRLFAVVTAAGDTGSSVGGPVTPDRPSSAPRTRSHAYCAGFYAGALEAVSTRHRPLGSGWETTPDRVAALDRLGRSGAGAHRAPPARVRSGRRCHRTPTTSSTPSIKSLPEGLTVSDLAGRQPVRVSCRRHGRSPRCTVDRDSLPPAQA